VREVRVRGCIRVVEIVFKIAEGGGEGPLDEEGSEAEQY